MNTKQQIEKLAKKYPCIVKWCKEMQSYDYYITNQLIEAEQDSAPLDAIYKQENGVWRKANDLTNKELRERLLNETS